MKTTRKPTHPMNPMPNKGKSKPATKPAVKEKKLEWKPTRPMNPMPNKPAPAKPTHPMNPLPNR